MSAPEILTRCCLWYASLSQPTHPPRVMERLVVTKILCGGGPRARPDEEARRGGDGSCVATSLPKRRNRLAPYSPPLS